METFAGIDVSMEQCSLCVMRNDGVIDREAQLTTDPDQLIAFFRCLPVVPNRIGLEAGPFSQWLYARLAEAELPVVCIETRQAKAVLSARGNKTDRSDAEGIAHLMRTGWYRPVHVKTQRSQELRVLLTSRKLLVCKLVDLENEIRGVLRNFGCKVGRVNRRNFADRIQGMLVEHTAIRPIIEAMLRVRAQVLMELEGLNRMVVRAVHEDKVCRRLMTVPGVGPLVALTYRTTIDVPSRFSRSRAVAAHLGLTPRKYQSGELERSGRVSKCGDAMARAALYEAAQVLLMRVKAWSRLKSWGLRVAQRRGLRKAIVAVARRLAGILFRIWIDGSSFQWSPKAAAAKTT